MALMTLLSAVIPSAVIMTWFHRRDVFPEPRAVLWKTFSWGVVSTLPVLLVVNVYDGAVDSVADPALRGVLSAFFSAALPEEFFKFLVVVLFAARLRDFDEPMDGIVYGVAASLGFATLENLLYVAEGGIVTAAVRAVTSVPGHALYGALMGMYVARAKFDPARANRHLALGLLVPTLFHGLYDAPLLAASAAYEDGMPDAVAGPWMLLVPVTLLIMGFWVRRLINGLRAAQLELEAETNGSTTETKVVKRRPHPALLRALTILGIVSAGFGALMGLGIALAFFTGSVKPEDSTSTLIGAAIISGAPLAFGLWLLLRGKRGPATPPSTEA